MSQRIGLKRVFKDTVFNNGEFTDKLKIPSVSIINAYPPNPTNVVAGDIVYDNLTTSMFYFDGVQWRELIGSSSTGTTSLSIPRPPGRLHVAASNDASVNWEPPTAANETSSNRIFLHAPDETELNNYLILQAQNTSGPNPGVSLLTGIAATYGNRYPGYVEIAGSGGIPFNILSGGNVSVSSGTSSDINLSCGSGTTSSGGQIVLAAGNGLTPTAQGGDITILAGDGSGVSNSGHVFISGGDSANVGAEIAVLGGSLVGDGEIRLITGGLQVVTLDNNQNTNIKNGELNVIDDDVNVIVGNVDIQTPTSGLRTAIVTASDTSTNGPNWTSVNVTMNGYSGFLTISFSGSTFSTGEQVQGVITNSVIVAGPPQSLIFMQTNDNSGLSRVYVPTINQIINGQFTFTIHALDSSGASTLYVYWWIVNQHS